MSEYLEVSRAYVCQDNSPIGAFSSQRSWMKWYRSSDTPTLTNVSMLSKVFRSFSYFLNGNSLQLLKINKHIKTYLSGKRKTSHGLISCVRAIYRPIVEKKICSSFLAAEVFDNLCSHIERYA